MPRLLELFSGTGSLSKVCRGVGWETISLDNEKKFNPDLLMSIADFDETMYPQNHFTWVHASPPCTEFSYALTTRPRDLEAGDELAQIALRILDYFAQGGAVCTLENPVGLMRTRPYMQQHEHRLHILDYCKYGFPYRKRTCLWSWNLDWQVRPLCRYDCAASEGRRHIQCAQRGQDRSHVKNKHTQAELYQIPAALVNDLVGFITQSQVRRYDQILDILNKIKFPTLKTGRHLGLGKQCFTLGCTLRSRGSTGFDEVLPNGKAVNRRTVPRTIDQNLGHQLWDLLQEEAKYLDFAFSSVQVNKNFPGAKHRDKNDTNYQYCTSLGDFTGGELCWTEGDREFKANTHKRWLKMDGRTFEHWVNDYDGLRYSIVLFSNVDHPPKPVYWTP